MAVSTYDGRLYGVPLYADVSALFYNKDLLRKIGKDEAFIEGLPDAVDKYTPEGRLPA